MLHDMSKLEFGALITAAVRFIYKSILLGQKKIGRFIILLTDLPTANKYLSTFR